MDLDKWRQLVQYDEEISKRIKKLYSRKRKPEFKRRLETKRILTKTLK